MEVTKQNSINTTDVHFRTMGAYISINNNTPDEWHCKVGPDKSSLKVEGIIVGAIATAGAILATHGIVVKSGAGDNLLATAVDDSARAFGHLDGASRAAFAPRAQVEHGRALVAVVDLAKVLALEEARHAQLLAASNAVNAADAALDVARDLILAARHDAAAHAAASLRLDAADAAVETATAQQHASWMAHYMIRSTRQWYQQMIGVKEREAQAAEALHAAHENLKAAIVAAVIPARTKAGVAEHEITALQAAYNGAQRAQDAADAAAARVPGPTSEFWKFFDHLDEAGKAAFGSLEELRHGRALQAMDETNKTVTITGADGASVIVHTVTLALRQDGYARIVPGGSHQWEQNHWQQATCVKTTVVNETDVEVETLFVSGETINTTNSYDIQHYLDTIGTEKTTIYARTEATQ